MEFKEGLWYQESHEWVREEDDVVVIGISDYAQDSLGDVVYVEFPETGTEKKKGDPFGVVESVKAASDVYMPLTGEIVAVNEALEDDPAIVNKDPFGEGWLIKIRPTDASEKEGLLDAAGYRTFTEGLEE